MSDDNSGDEKEEKVLVAKTAVDLQRLKLLKLMKNPDKPVIIPDRPKTKNTPAVPEFVRNVMGSSAGAGSGEFHVYRHLRRKEYARQKHIQEKGHKELLDEEYHKKLEENKKLAQENTAKKRTKRLKRKQKLKEKKLKTEENTETNKNNAQQCTTSNSNSNSESSDEEKCKFKEIEEDKLKIENLKNKVNIKKADTKMEVDSDVDKNESEKKIESKTNPNLENNDKVNPTPTHKAVDTTQAQEDSSLKEKSEV